MQTWKQHPLVLAVIAASSLSLAGAAFATPGPATASGGVSQTTRTASDRPAQPTPDREASRETDREADRETNRAFIAKAFDAWAAGGTGFFNDVLSPDVVWTIAGSSPHAGTYRGREALVRRAVMPLTSRLATPIRPTVRQLWADGDHVIVHWDGTATAADGVAYRNSYVWILRMAQRRAVEVTAFLDMNAYDEVVRRVPARTQAP